MVHLLTDKGVSAMKSFRGTNREGKEYIVHQDCCNPFSDGTSWRSPYLVEWSVAFLPPMGVFSGLRRGRNAWRGETLGQPSIGFLLVRRAFNAGGAIIGTGPVGWPTGVTTWGLEEWGNWDEAMRATESWLRPSTRLRLDASTLQACLGPE